MSPGLPALLRCPLPPDAAQHSSLSKLLRCTAGNPTNLRLLRSEVRRRPASEGERNTAVGMSLQINMPADPATDVSRQQKVSVTAHVSVRLLVDAPKPCSEHYRTMRCGPQTMLGAGIICITAYRA